MTRPLTRSRWISPLLAASIAIALPHACLAKPKKKPATPPVATSPAEMPTDLNLASLRVAAIQSLYELDASVDQLRAVRSAAPGLADEAKRKEPKGSSKLAAALLELRDGLLAADDAKISTARDAVAEAMGDTELEDEVHPSAAARGRAVAIARSFSAGQLAAYLAAHADEVVGPGERMVSALVDIQTDPPEEADAQVRQVADEVGQLVAGAADPAHATLAAAKAAGWLKANRSALVTDDTRAKLEASAQATVGEVPPAEVLGHWFENELAELLANPQIDQATASLIATHPAEAH